MKEIDAVGHRRRPRRREVRQQRAHHRRGHEGPRGVHPPSRPCTTPPTSPASTPASRSWARTCLRSAFFDTAFHQTMPAKAYMYALPYDYYTNDGVRRYGFHGTSHRYVSKRCAELMGKPIEELKLISCHMGNGSSICAIMNGQERRHLHGLHPLVGLPMGTRVGDVDPGAMQFIMNKYNMDIDSMLNVLNKKSGVLGISASAATSATSRPPPSRATSARSSPSTCSTTPSPRSSAATPAAMNGVDAVIFTAGVGENAPTHPRGHLLLPRLPGRRARRGGQRQARRRPLHQQAGQQSPALGHPHQRGARHRPRHPRHRLRPVR